MTVIEAIIAWAAAPLLGWGWTVERRLGKQEIKLDYISDNTELLVKHLIVKGVDRARSDSRDASESDRESQ